MSTVKIPKPKYAYSLLSPHGVGYLSFQYYLHLLNSNTQGLQILDIDSTLSLQGEYNLLNLPVPMILLVRDPIEIICSCENYIYANTLHDFDLAEEKNNFLNPIKYECITERLFITINSEFCFLKQKYDLFTNHGEVIVIDTQDIVPPHTINTMRTVAEKLNLNYTPDLDKVFNSMSKTTAALMWRKFPRFFLSNVVIKILPRDILPYISFTITGDSKSLKSEYDICHDGIWYSAINLYGTEKRIPYSDKALHGRIEKNLELINIGEMLYNKYKITPEYVIDAIKSNKLLKIEFLNAFHDYVKLIEKFSPNHSARWKYFLQAVKS